MQQMKCYRFMKWMLIGTIILMFLSGFAFTYDTSTPALYVMVVNDQQVGVLKHAARGLSHFDQVISELSDVYPNDVTIESNILFREVNLKGLELTPENDLQEAIREALDIKVDAYAILIDGQKIGYVRSTADADKVIEAFKAPYIQLADQDGDRELSSVKLKENIDIVIENVEFDIIKGVEDVVVLIDKRVEKGLLTVITTQRFVQTEEIPYMTELQDDKNLEKGKAKVVQEGQKGLKEIVLIITNENGVEVNREIAEQNVVKEATNKIEARGTKEPVVVRQTTTTTKTATPTATTTKATATTTTTVAPTASRGSTSAADVVNVAKLYLGKPYKPAAKGPDAFDCSGFTYFVYKQFGITISGGSSSQASAGRAVQKSDLLPGDLVLFTSPNSRGAIGHVGIYIGGGNFIHASSGSAYCVKIDSLLTGGYASRYVTARRLL